MFLKAFLSFPLHLMDGFAGVHAFQGGKSFSFRIVKTFFHCFLPSSIADNSDDSLYSVPFYKNGGSLGQEIETILVNMVKPRLY